MSNWVNCEFICTVCHKIFDFRFDSSMDGNYRVHCPNCGHIHYRQVKKGIVTDTRFFDNQSSTLLIDDIRPLKSTLRDKHRTEIHESARAFISITNIKHKLRKAVRRYAK